MPTILNSLKIIVVLHKWQIVLSNLNDSYVYLPQKQKKERNYKLVLSCLKKCQLCKYFFKYPCKYSIEEIIKCLKPVELYTGIIVFKLTPFIRLKSLNLVQWYIHDTIFLDPILVWIYPLRRRYEIVSYRGK